MTPLKINSPELKFNFFNHQKKPTMGQLLYRHKYMLLIFILVIISLAKIFSSFLTAEPSIPFGVRDEGAFIPIIGTAQPDVQKANIYYKSSVSTDNKKIEKNSEDNKILK